MFPQIRQIGRWTNLKFANAGTDIKRCGSYLDKNIKIKSLVEKKTTNNV